ncbi:hypothetical protein SDC9_04401 [bioreactor metagenome]|uniref:Uncharacterized protein n=1 Tax=bioreactor metagenome TaxID=1076179 RepID=A0A644SW69_9ZZZZ
MRQECEKRGGTDRRARVGQHHLQEDPVIAAAIDLSGIDQVVRNRLEEGDEQQRRECAIQPGQNQTRIRVHQSDLRHDQEERDHRDHLGHEHRTLHEGENSLASGKDQLSQGESPHGGEGDLQHRLHQPDEKAIGVETQKGNLFEYLGEIP